MANSTTKILTIVSFLVLISQGYSQCSLQDITIVQRQSGVVRNQPKWNVTISNRCICTQTDVKLNCTDFQTILPIPTSILKVEGNVCTLNDGNPVYSNTDISFEYASSKSFPLNPISSQINCS
uniref:TPD1 protein homolog 1-like n=1 Tax=Cicer arietinum TaxID=3827 RepID=A0A1S3ED16_CICAR|nr:TPD1 protein homolog 1-like [Cicer arietinum]